MRLWPLLLSLAACTPRERVYVPAAPPPDPAASRIAVRPGAAYAVARGPSKVLIDAPAAMRVREIARALLAAFDAGAKEAALLVDTAAGEGEAALPTPVATSGLAVHRDGKIHMLWRYGEPLDVAGARVRPGFDGAYELVEAGSTADLQVAAEDPLEAGETSRPRKAVGGTLEDARFILLRAEADDVLKDVVLSLLALEARFPGRVVLEIPAASGKP